MNDVIAWLAEANPVRVEDLSSLEAPNLSRGRRRLVLPATAALAAAAAATIGLLVLGGPSNREPLGADAVPPPPEIPISLAEAAAALGAPVVLPQTPLIGPSDIGSVTKECPGPWGRTCAITIRFFLTWDSNAVGPTSAYGPTGSGGPTGYGVQIRYSLGGYPDPLRVYRGEGGRSTVVDLSGTPALLITGDPNDTAGTAASYVEFQLNGVTIAVVQRYAGGPTALSVAQSIVDRSR